MLRSCLFLGLMVVGARTLSQVDYLPDIITWEDQLYDIAYDTNTIPGRTLLRLSNGTPNLGPGRLELRGGAVIDGKREVWQRIYRSDQTYWERLAGYFTHHDGHGHIHYDNWCQYRLREKLLDGNPGAIVAVGAKTSFCILDLVIYDSSLFGFRNPGYYRTCGSSVQGLTPGWADIYDKSLQDQWIDITGLPDGEYWLESEVDPDNNILELDETNNVSRVLIWVGPPPPPVVDRFEENDSREQVDARPEGGTNSPNFGIVNATMQITDLSMEDANDYFKFKLNNTGGPSDHISINSQYSDSDLDLQLLNSSGQVLAGSYSSSNSEYISLNGRPAGTYYIRVYPYSGQNPQYILTIDPAANGAPSIIPTGPTSNLWIEADFETVPVSWIASDPENDPTRVALFMDADTTLDKGTLPIQGYQNLNGSDGAANINTAQMPLGKWYLYFKVTDGGAQSGAWATGSFTLYEKGDVNFDGHYDIVDYFMILARYGKPNMPPEWNIICDVDRDGDFDRIDLRILRGWLLKRLGRG